MLDAGGRAPKNLAENYGARIVPACGFAQVEIDIEVYSPIYAILFTGISFMVQIFPEHQYLIVETLRQVHLKHFTCHLLRFCAPA